MDTIDNIIHSILFDVVLKAVLARIIASVPFLALPIINPIFALILDKVASLFYDEMSKFIEFKVIDLQVGEQKNNYDAAVNNLKEVLSKPEQSPEEIQKAKDELKKRLHDLINIKPN